MLQGLAYTTFEQVQRGAPVPFDVVATVTRTPDRGIATRRSRESPAADRP